MQWYQSEVTTPVIPDDENGVWFRDQGFPVNKILDFDEHSMNIFCDEAGVWFRVNYITTVRVTVPKSSDLSIWGW